MDSGRPIQLVGMALLRGLLDESALRTALDSERDLLETLKAQGTLDDEDLQDLARLVEAELQIQGQALAPMPESEPSNLPTSPFRQVQGQEPWDSLPAAGEDTDGTGRQVLRVLTLPTWKHYRNLRFVAEGGMGRVFKAFDPSLRRVVALKFLRRGDLEMERRFVLEAQNQARVEHPNICKVFEVGEWQGQSYIAMQFLKGTTLESAAPELDLVDKVKVMEAVAEAIHAAHRQGLIHRDLKPGNIMVVAGERGPEPTILDFGLAKGMEATGLTVQGLVIGTTHYMAPEQARGDHDKVGRCTDVYGLGATLHKVLTGKVPFSDTQGMDVLRRTLEEDIPSLARLVPDLPEDLDTIVRKCLEKDPVHRYESALAVAEDLRRWREGEPILARKPTLRYRAGKWARKHRLVVAVGAVGVVVALAFAGMGIHARVTAASLARYAHYFGQEAERIEALLRYIRLSPAHDIEPEMAAVMTRIQGIRDQVKQGGALVQGPGHFALGRAALALDRPKEARDYFIAARKAGFSDSELGFLEARALVRLYQEDLAKARQIPDPASRAVRRRSLEQQFRKEALPLLEKASGLGLEPGPHQKGLIALVEGRTEDARALGHQVNQISPWFYEGLTLVSDADTLDALNCPDLDGGLQKLQKAVAALERCQAPSDPGLLKRRARLLALGAQWQALKGLPPTRESEALRDVAKRWKVLEPHNSEAFLAEVRADLIQLDWNAFHGKPDLPGAQRLEATAREVLARNPEHPEALGLLSRTLQVRSLISRDIHAKPSLIGQEEAMKIALRVLELDPLQDGLIARVGNVASDLFSTLREEGKPIGEWSHVIRRLEALENQFPELPFVSQSLALASMELAETARVDGQDPTSLARKALEAARRFQVARPDQFSGFRQECNARLVLAWHELYKGVDPLKQAHLAWMSSERALALNPRSYLDALNCAIALRIQAEWFLRQGKDPLPFIRRAESALGHAKRLSETSWYNIFLDCDLALLEAEWRLRNGKPLKGLLVRASRPLGQAWVKSDTAEAALLLARVARLKFQAKQGAEKAALLALGNLERRFPRMPETLQEGRLLRALFTQGGIWVRRSGGP